MQEDRGSSPHLDVGCTVVKETPFLISLQLSKHGHLEVESSSNIRLDEDLVSRDDAIEAPNSKAKSVWVRFFVLDDSGSFLTDRMITQLVHLCFDVLPLVSETSWLCPQSICSSGDEFLDMAIIACLR